MANSSGATFGVCDTPGAVVLFADQATGAVGVFDASFAGLAGAVTNQTGATL